MGIVPMSATPLLENFAIIEMSVVLMQTVINIKRPHSQLGNSWLLSGTESARPNCAKGGIILACWLLLILCWYHGQKEPGHWSE